jgi:NADH-quinone oxidoreductase subunit J
MPISLDAFLTPAVWAPGGGLLAQAVPVSTPLEPAGILLLCVIGGIGTMLLLPSRRGTSVRRVGGVLLALAGAILAALLIRWAAGSGAQGSGAAGVTGLTGIYFWLFSGIALVAAVRVVTHTQPVYSALYFVLTVFATAGLFLLLRAEFIAAALVLIYAGAILVTYVFVIMLAAQATAHPGGALSGLADCDNVSREPFMVSLVGFVLMGVILFVIFDKYAAIQPASSNGLDVPAASGESLFPAAMYGPTQQLGAFLFENHLVTLELAGLILTIAMVGAIIISRRHILLSDEPGLTGEPSAAAVNADLQGELVLGPATPIDDDPHSIPVYGTKNPRQKAYPET